MVAGGPEESGSPIRRRPNISRLVGLGLPKRNLMRRANGESHCALIVSRTHAFASGCTCSGRTFRGDGGGGVSGVTVIERYYGTSFGRRRVSIPTESDVDLARAFAVRTNPCPYDDRKTSPISYFYQRYDYARASATHT